MPEREPIPGTTPLPPLTEAERKLNPDPVEEVKEQLGQTKPREQGEPPPPVLEQITAEDLVPKPPDPLEQILGPQQGLPIPEIAQPEKVELVPAGNISPKIEVEISPPHPTPEGLSPGLKPGVTYELFKASDPFKEAA